MKHTLLAMLLIVVPVVATADTLLLPGAKEPFRLRIEPPADVEATWTRFLAQLFDHFDRNGDGALQPAEAARIFPLPSPEGRELVIDFSKIDADGNGKASRDELKAFCRPAGFGPVVVTVAAPPVEAVRAGKALFRLLDGDGDGRLSAEELRRAAALLRRVDENEDEALTVAELLAVTSPADRAAATATVRWTADTDRADAVLRVGTDEKGPRRGPDGRWELLATQEGQRRDTADAAAFCRSQLRAVGATGVGRKLLEDDPVSAGLLGLFDFADRDGDGKLTAKELDAYLALAELGAGCQVWMQVTDRGRDLFDTLDTDSDGRLTLRELNTAPEQLRAGSRAEDIPVRMRLAVRRGTPGQSFAGLALTDKPKPRPSANAAVSGPRWFDAQDRNRDGLLSPAEFLGPPEVFRRFDADGDGLIDRGEARRAQP